MKPFVFAATLGLFATFSFANTSTSHSDPNANRQWNNNWTRQVNLDTPEVRCYPIRQISITDAENPQNGSQFQWIVNKAQTALQINLPRCLGEKSMSALQQQIQYEMAINGYSSARIEKMQQDLHSGHLAFSLTSEVTQPLTYTIEEVSTEQYEQSLVASTIKPTQTAQTAKQVAIQAADLVQDNQVSAFANQTVIATQQAVIKEANTRSLREQFTPLYLEQGASANTTINAEPVEIASIGIADSAQEMAVEAREKNTKQIAQSTESSRKFRINQTDLLGINGYLGIQSQGATSLGRLKGYAGLSFSDILQEKDAFNIFFSHELKLRDNNSLKKYDRHFEFNYHLPFGSWALDFAHQEDRRYHQIFHSSTNQEGYGVNSKTDLVTLSYHIYESQTQKLSATAGAWGRKSKEYFYLTESEKEKMKGWIAGLTYETKIGDGSFSLSSQYKQGKRSNALDNDETARPSILNAKLAWTQPFKLINQAFEFKTEWYAQWSKKSLSLQDQFTIGGLNKLRGFNSRYTLAGDQGWLSRNELSWKVNNTDKSLYVALDAAKVANKVTQQKRSQSVTTVAVGIKGAKKGFEYDVFVGKPISKPKGIKASQNVVGVNVNYRF